MPQDVFLNAVRQSEAGSLFAAWFEAHGSSTERIAVFGKGRDFELIGKAAPSLAQKLVALIDDSGAEGTVSLEKGLALQPDLIVLASLPHQETMRRRLREASYAGRLLLLYRNDPEIGALGLFAYDPVLDWPVPSPPVSRKNIQFPARIRRILLFSPPFAKANARHKKTMPLGLLYLAAAIRKSFPDINIELYDAHIARHSWDDARAFVASRDFDMLLCSYWSAQADTVFLLSQHVRKTRDAVVVHGGVHPSLSPADSAQYCDVLIAGEGEQQIVGLIRHLNAGGTPGSFKGDTALLANLDELDFPDWSLLKDARAYDHPMHVVGGWRFPVLGSRGCPFKCSFCSSPLLWKGRVRWRSPQNVADEMDEIKQRYGVDRFHFWDDNFLLDPKYAQKLCEELLFRKRTYFWCGLSRASDILRRAEMLPLLKQAGCVGIEIGVESFSDQVSKAVDKGEFAGETEKAAEALIAAGIAPLYTHMLFVPGETIDSYPEKESFIRRLSAGLPNSLKSDSDLGQLTTPHIGTNFAAEAPSLGLLLWRGAADSFHHRINFIPNSLLDDIPAKASDAVMPDPLPWLARIAQAIFDWEETDMRLFVRSSGPLWDSIDGKMSVLKLAESLCSTLGIPREKALCLASLHVVNWARRGLLKSAARPV